MSQSHWIKGGSADEAFLEQCFLWETGASVGLDFDLLTFKIFYEGKKKKKNIKHGRKGKKMQKHNRTSLQLCVSTLEAVQVRESLPGTGDQNRRPKRLEIMFLCIGQKD